MCEGARLRSLASQREEGGEGTFIGVTMVAQRSLGDLLLTEKVDGSYILS